MIRGNYFAPMPSQETHLRIFPLRAVQRQQGYGSAPYDAKGQERLNCRKETGDDVNNGISYY